MADMQKLRRRSTLGAPPPLADASPNLLAPEIAPAPPPEPVPAPATTIVPPPARVRSQEPTPPPRAAMAPEGRGAGEGPRPRDGRSARRTGRTLQFATRVSPEFDDRVRAIAAREGILLVEVLERALDAYEASLSG